jgi:hypothetical protein
VHEPQVAEPPPPPAAARIEEPRFEAPRAEEPRMHEPRIDEPRIDAKQLLNDSGLVMIETDRAKVRIQPEVVEQQAPQQLGRPRRERSKAHGQDEELVQIETRK